VSCKCCLYFSLSNFDAVRLAVWMCVKFSNLHVRTSLNKACNTQVPERRNSLWCSSHPGTYLKEIGHGNTLFSTKCFVKQFLYSNCVYTLHYHSRKMYFYRDFEFTWFNKFWFSCFQHPHGKPVVQMDAITQQAFYLCLWWLFLYICFQHWSEEMQVTNQYSLNPTWSYNG
jgi:hypothetical protein